MKSRIQKLRCPNCAHKVIFRQISTPIEIRINISNLFQLGTVLQKKKQVAICNDCGYESKVKKL